MKRLAILVAVVSIAIPATAGVYCHYAGGEEVLITNTATGKHVWTTLKAVRATGACSNSIQGLND